MDFVIIANAWEAGIANPTSKHRIASELARRGHRVLWLEGSGMRRPSLGSGADRARIARKIAAAWRGARRVDHEDRGQNETGDEQSVSSLRTSAFSLQPSVSGGIWVLAPLFLPLPRYAWVRWLNGRLAIWTARCWCRRLGLQTPVLINYVPVLAEAVRLWRGAKIYHCVDRWDAFKMYDAAVMREMDARCCRSADAVVASARELYDRCRQLNPQTVLIPHGVDHGHFARALAPPPRPADLPAGPTIGFFGLLSEWLDQELIAHLAAALPDARIVLIGAADVPLERLQSLANVLLAGPRPFRDLPAYVAHFDLGIIPFVVNDLTRAVNPIKLREMLSAGCPVVSTALPEVDIYARQIRSPRAVGVAADATGFTALVRDRLEHPASLAERRAISAAVANETWEAKVDEILALANRISGGARKESRREGST
jgi:glycosyltransferase involved in cell wall biosynthesis